MVTEVARNWRSNRPGASWIAVVAVVLGITAAGGSIAAPTAIMSIDPARPNRVVFEPVEAKFVRLVVENGDASRACIDELEIFGGEGGGNLALASAGGKATASSCLAGYPAHKIEHLNDGQYGNDRSWIVDEPTGWAQIELPESASVASVVFSRDRTGRFTDRVPASLSVQVSADGRTWRTVKDVRTDRVVLEKKYILPNRAISLDFFPRKAKYVRLAIHQINSGPQPCVDELEVFGPDAKKNLALAAGGAKATASSCLEGFPIHKVEHLNDGKYTNARSWIAGESTGWAQIELPETAEVGRVVFSRDREGTHRDRLSMQFDILVSEDGQAWQTVKKIAALTPGRIDRTMPEEDPRDWAWRVVAALPASMHEEANELAGAVESADDVAPLLELYRVSRNRHVMVKRLAMEFNPAALRRAVAHLSAAYPGEFRPPEDFDKKLAALEARIPELVATLEQGDAAGLRSAMAESERMIAFARGTLLANPLLDFDELMILKRKTPDTKRSDTYWQWGQMYGMTVNWSCDFRPKNPPVAPWWDEEIVAWPIAGPGNPPPPVRTVFKAKPTHMIQHPELHFDADRLLFSMPGPEGAFQVFEVNVDGTGLRQITTDTGADVDNGDPCYLPDGRIIFNSTRMFIGVPCEDGQSYVANLCIADADGRGTRMLTFDQESNWYPTLLANGRVLYTRYEYANISHQFGRLLFQMNPDGTNQDEYYGSNSYWPNSIFYARPVPGHPTMVAGVVCGHHGPNRTGRLVLFDPARGRRETSGAVQTIPGYGKKVERIVQDDLYGADWPKFVHPWPLSEQYYLVSARLHPEQVEYAIYLADVFDNMVEIARLDDYSLLEPIPLAARPAPPAIPDRIDPADDRATVFIADIYQGEGLRGVPRGSVKQLRLFTYNYVYRHTVQRGFGHLATPGVDGPWEPRNILGTVPVRADGSALFRVPANTPISVQPLDEDGRALQLMRSWFTAMPGEVLSCVGCHEKQNTSPVAASSILGMEDPAPIAPWYGPARGFDFELEVQPMLDRHCVGCHDGTEPGRPDLVRKSEEEKLRINQAYHQATESHITTILTPAFIALHPYVRRPHAESNYGSQVAAEYSADTSPLVQMLTKGHHNVHLDRQAWERLYTWIDLGAPDHGSWKNSEWGVPANFHERRLEVLRKFGGRTDDVEWMPPPAEIPEFIPPPPEKTAAVPVDCPNWPFDAARAVERRDAVELPKTLALELPDESVIELALIPPGEFVMGDAEGAADERDLARVRIDRPFYMARHEVTNAQMAAVGRSDHFSGHVGWRSIDWRGEGHVLSAPEQPAVRVSWHEAMAFCRALSAQSGRHVTLPTEAQWEWAARAGSDSPFWFGTLDDDFSAFENLAGREQRNFAFGGKRKWYLRDDRFDDRSLVTAKVGSY